MAKKVNITSYISSLLYDYSLVVVPGLGAFLTQFAPAKVKPEEGVVQPPVKTLQFNEKLNLNDGLLINHIARHERITEDEAELYVAHYVDNIKSQLNSGELVMLEGIGSFTKSHADDALIAFFPDEHANFSTATFGLAPIELPQTETINGSNANEEVATPLAANLPPMFTELTDEDVHPDEQEPLATIPLATDGTQKRSLHEVLASGAAGGVSTQVASSEETPTPPPPPAKNTPSYLWWLVPALMLVAFIFILTQLPSGRNQNQVAQQTEPTTLTPAETDTTQATTTTEEETAPTTQTDNTTANANSVTGNFVTDEDDPATNAPAATNNTQGNATTTTGTAATTSGSSTTPSTRGNAAVTTTQQTTPTAAKPAATATGRGNAATTTSTTADTQIPKGYYVVIASFDTQAKAQKEVNKLRKTKANAYALQPDKGKYRVGLYYESQAAAQSAQAALKSGAYSGAWILKQ